MQPLIHNVKMSTTNEKDITTIKLIGCVNKCNNFLCYSKINYIKVVANTTDLFNQQSNSLRNTHVHTSFSFTFYTFYSKGAIEFFLVFFVNLHIAF